MMRGSSEEAQIRRRIEDWAKALRAKDLEGIMSQTRSTVCFRKIAGEWMVVHEHSSVPFYMDGSYRAAVDLQP
jgi:ketosteroid isomerase-like protein